MYRYTLELLHVCVHKLRFICTGVHSIWSLLLFFNERICRGNIETLNLFIILTYIHLTFKTHILRFSLSKSQNQKRNLNLFWKLKRWIEKPINLVASSFIIKFYHMHVQYVGIGILIDLKLCFNIGLSPPTVGNCDKLLLYIFNATFCQIHFAQTSGQTRTKWRLSSVCTKYGLKFEKWW